MTTLVTLVGEQPIPNLLPIRALCPQRVLFVHTGSKTRGTEPVARRIARLVEQETKPDFVAVPPYNLLAARQKINDRLAEPAIFNLTGGTKMMALAAYALAVEQNAPFVYLRTEGPQGRDQKAVLYHYTFDDHRPVLSERETLSAPLISLNDYLLAHLPDYREEGFSKEKDSQRLSVGGRFEQAVAHALDGWVDEWKAGVRPQKIKEQVEIDLAIRCGNQVGIMEIKLGGRGSGKHAVDQLTTAAAREYLGIYTTRFLVTGGERDSRYVALAHELDIHVITLSGYRHGRLSRQDINNLRRRVAELLPCRKQR